MKLVSFDIHTPVGTFTRIGAHREHCIIDLNMAYARRLVTKENRSRAGWRMHSSRPPCRSFWLAAPPQWRRRGRR